MHRPARMRWRGRGRGTLDVKDVRLDRRRLSRAWRMAAEKPTVRTLRVSHGPHRTGARRDRSGNYSELLHHRAYRPRQVHPG
ncbi:hypothetical protein ARTHRO8AJ_210159 [Arthrobacter sp. 8AJ]|nr:hypothetical protein ARTHRO8AJ_210159 [Arthrobacter sp. 8AJ]